MFSVLFSLLAVLAPIGREPSAPYVTGDTFRAYADFAYDELDQSLDPSLVEPGNIIFTRTDYLRDFFDKIHPRIQSPYVLISHVSDEPAPGAFAPHLDDPKLIAWFTHNYDGTPHPKIHPIPIGLASRYRPWGQVESLAKITAAPPSKKHLLFLNFTLLSYYPERFKVFKQFAQAPYCYRTGKKEFEEYLKDVAASLFVAAPRGLGLDTYRLWEAIHVGTIPIVKSSSLDGLYEGLPVLIIQDWDEVTEEFLRKKAVELQAKSYSLEKLSIDYWLKQIDQAKRSIL